MSEVMGVKVVTKKSIPAREPKGDVSIHINKKVGRFVYTFSVQRHKGTYGYESGLFEVGIWQKGSMDIKVVGWLTWSEVRAIYEFWRYCIIPLFEFYL